MKTSAMKKAWFGALAGTPLGTVWAAVSEAGLVAVDFQEDNAIKDDAVADDAIINGGGKLIERLHRMGFEKVEHDPERVSAALEQIGEYLAGTRREFDLPIDWAVQTPFQQEALRATLAIPYGQVSTYGELARGLGRPRAARAVGRAEATNPLPLVIPCHRVLGSDGALHGYGAGRGLETKAWLLKLEGRI
jgi:methylated-DNA-[protein]-cysteine S-methyltransferase